VATIIDSRDHNRYEVVKVSGLLDDPLRVVVDSGRAEKSTSTDAFGRLRTSNGLTLFDSSHRYRDNGLWATQTASGGASNFNTNEGVIDLTVTGTSGSKVYRETIKVFSYQPGKSLLVLSTFVFNTAKANLRQRVGYFSAENGLFLELNGTSLSIVRRSSVTGSVVETKINQSSWNIDKLDGTGISGFNLDITKAQIFWADFEWLGVGSVRFGFVLDGKFIACHSFNHANSSLTTYMTTATLPVRYEIENTGTTTGNSTLKQICSSVISEGGYELNGAKRVISTPIATPVALTTAGTTYSIASIRLKSTCLDASVILSHLSILGITNNANYLWEVVAGGTTSGGTWTSAGADSSVEYKLGGGTLTGGTVLSTGYTSASTQAAAPVDIVKSALFTFQLERNSFTSTPYEMTLAVKSDTANANVFGSLGFEEVTR
jgi:hypothetical protein